MDTTDTNPAITPRKGRISPSLREAVALITASGYTVAEAAKAVGYKEHSLVQALKKPHVRALRADVKRAWLSSQTEKAWVTVATLADSAASEDVRLKAARTILDAAGELSPKDDGSKAPRQLIQIVANQATVRAGVQVAERAEGVIEVVNPEAATLTIEDARFAA